MYELIASLIASTFPFREMVQISDAFQLKTSLSAQLTSLHLLDWL